MDQILAFDQWLFHIINGAELGWLSDFSPYYRHKLFWVPLYVFIVAVILYNFRQHGLRMVLFAVLTVGLSDTVSSKWIKYSVERVRPCNDPEVRPSVIQRVRCGGGYSFTSSHATNHGALAFYFFFLFQGYPRWWRWLGVGWAVSIGLAQVYVGVHYPLDIVAGLCLGLLLGLLTAVTYRRFFAPL